MIVPYTVPETFVSSAQIRHFDAPKGLISAMNITQSSNEIILKIRTFDFENKNAANNISFDDRELYINLPWVKEFFEESSEMKDKKKLLLYFQKIDELANNKEYRLCNRFFASIKTENLSNHLLVGLLRLTYSHKEKLSYWDTFYNKAKSELTNRKVNADIELLGLS